MGAHLHPKPIAVEAPVALEVNGIGLAVMMATPEALEDFAVGFAVAEGLLRDAGAIEGLDAVEVRDGWIVRLRVGGVSREAALARARTRVTESACGLCGAESLAQVARALPRVTRPMAPTHAALRAAMAALPERQAMGRRTRATHAAALCDADGAIRLIREDVGRHNALDKLVGGALRAGEPMEGRFALVTSRLSYELVEKAVRAGLGALAALSAPTSMALARAKAAGLPVVAPARALAPEPPSA